MATLKDALKSISNYPVPQITFDTIAEMRGLVLTQEANSGSMGSQDFKFAQADLLIWIASAPNIQEGGVIFNMLVSDREELRRRANAIYNGVTQPPPERIRATFGYKGDSL